MGLHLVQRVGMDVGVPCPLLLLAMAPATRWWQRCGVEYAVATAAGSKMGHYDFPSASVPLLSDWIGTRVVGAL